LTPFQQAVLAWSDRNRRELPWRQTRDPWAILVSELMLQQTQVARVIPKYHAFLARFPDPTACASAPLGEVVQAWAGLGYNRRAVNLHKTALVLVHRWGGRMPDSLADLLALPGVGQYTARAVLAFAFERQAAVVDTNVGRVMARAVAGRRLTSAEVQVLADGQVPPGHGWEWNQALLDLGATVCTTRDPGCDRCPLAPLQICAWAAAGSPPPDPAAGSARTSRRQAPFDGSDRQGRGRLVDALRRGPVPLSNVAATCGWPTEPERAAAAAKGLVRDGLAEESEDVLTLPGSRCR
jgi:A/G-specific adenine glycosylase